VFNVGPLPVDTVVGLSIETLTYAMLAWWTASLCGGGDTSYQPEGERLESDPHEQAVLSIIRGFCLAVGPHRGKPKGRISVRRQQVKLLETGNVTMGVTLGKTILGQVDEIRDELFGNISTQLQIVMPRASGTCRR
jgi:hypothetical protein